MRGVKYGFVAAAVALTLVPSAGASPRAEAAQAGTTCPAFSVLHNDRIGPAVLPKGSYTITLRSNAVSCANASSLFAQFLQDFDGKLQKPWAVVAKGKGKAAFTSGGQPGFSVALSKGGGGGGQPSTLGTACPGTFQIENDDQIALLSFPKGAYKLVIPRGSIVTCAQASKLFARFLDFPSGALPKGWAMKSTVALFYKPANPNPKRKRFRVDPAT
jgi:hypothetical protein